MQCGAKTKLQSPNFACSAGVQNCIRFRIFIPSRHNGVPLRVPYVCLDIEAFFLSSFSATYTAVIGECTFLKASCKLHF